jgi:predicted enzyme related to lactoylglutathione lyase
MFGRKGKPLGGIYNRPPNVPHSYWLPYIKVADSRKTAEMVKKLRGKVLSGPMEVPGGDWVFVGSDLQGGTFAVHSVTPPARKTRVRKVAKPRAKKAAKRAVKSSRRR